MAGMCRPGTLYTRSAESVYAVAFDLQRLEVYGPRVPVIQGVRRSPNGINGAASFSVSSTGSLAFVPGPLVVQRWQLARVESKRRSRAG